MFEQVNVMVTSTWEVISSPMTTEPMMWNVHSRSIVDDSTFEMIDSFSSSVMEGSPVYTDLPIELEEDLSTMEDIITKDVVVSSTKQSLMIIETSAVMMTTLPVSSPVQMSRMDHSLANSSVSALKSSNYQSMFSMGTKSSPSDKPVQEATISMTKSYSLNADQYSSILNIMKSASASTTAIDNVSKSNASGSLKFTILLLLGLHL